MATKNKIRNRRRRSARFNHRTSSSTKPKNETTATYVATYSILSYPINLFQSNRLGTLVGAWYNSDREIYLAEFLTEPAVYLDALLHELIHAISDIGLAPDDRLTERQVNLVASVLADTLGRNPQLVQRLVSLLAGRLPQ